MADLEIIERTVSNGDVEIVVLTCTGKTTIHEGARVLRKKVRELIAREQFNILLNWGNMYYMDTSGLGELVSSFTAVKKEGGNLKLLYLQQQAQDFLAITRLLTVFDCFDNEEEALASFS